MSEQIKQLNAGVKIGPKFEYFNLGNVTIKSLAQNNIIPKKNYGDYNIKRPDGLLVDRTDKKNPKVIAVIEYKAIQKFKTDKDINEAIKQCNDYAQVLGAGFGVATDTNISIWINPKGVNKENNYTDEKGNKRNFEFIRDEQQQKISNNFYFHLQQTDQTNEESFSDETKETFKLIKRILDSNVGEKNSNLQDTIFVDPTNLAKSVWQDIYVATGKEPEKCLYNVVEIFIFKFLSDLGVLKTINSFSFLVEMIDNGEKDTEILNHYAQIIRKKIKKDLFPPDDEDGTTVINGTIFVNEKDEPVLEFASLFVKSLKKYDDFGDLTNVEKSFKTQLYETFLKRDSGVKGMGQFFTPRKVVENIVEMAKVENLKTGSRVGDPFCGVGGFPLEVIAKRNNKDFVIKNNKIVENIEYFGFDKGSSEKDSERTIILAKANMLIYLADLIQENPGITQEFSKVFNKTFSLKKGTLGTLADVSKKEEDTFDLIITNPPYVTSGSKTLKEEIEKDSEKQDFYKVNGTGLESLSVEWIINKLKKGGKGFIVLPEGIFRRKFDTKIRKMILNECYINGIISLPSKTFFTTPQKTYILAITKKENKKLKQEKQFFTYLVSDIGEELNVNRFDTGKSDLEEAKKLFRMFEGNEGYFTTSDKRCKIQEILKLENEVNNHWLVDKWWTKEEKKVLGIYEESELVFFDDFKKDVKDFQEKITNYKKSINTFHVHDDIKKTKIILNTIIDIERGKSKYTQLYCNNNKGIFPLYSAKTTNTGLMGEIDSYDYDTDCLTYTTNGVKAGTFFLRKKHKFSLNGDSAVILLKKELLELVDYNYLYFILRNEVKNYGFNWENKATPDKIGNMQIEIPIDVSGNFDIKMQRSIAAKYQKIEKIKNNFIDELEYFKNLQIVI